MSIGQLPAAEQELVAAVSGDTLMDYTRSIAQWVRLSGSEDEAKAFAYVADVCRSFGMRVELHAADALVSWPGKATLEVLGATPASFPCITHAFAGSTPPGGIEGEAIEERGANPGDLRGKVVISDGLANPGKGMAAEAAGVLAQININDQFVHEMIISPVWGTPTPQTAHLLPKLISVSINAEDGVALRRLAAAGPLRVRINAEVDTRWRQIPVLTAELDGQDEQFVLFSGHIDSWHYGAMDNGTANATMIEVARLLSARRDQLRRGMRLAFWSGHSHARYAGSTWYADHFWPELHTRCAAHVNVDSVGGMGATILSEGNSMAETAGFAGRAIKEVADQELEYKRFGRAGDQSFNGIGLPSMFMSLSGQPAGGPSGAVEEQMARLLGGGRGRSGGLGWWWHTTEDTMDKIDRDFLVRDASIYALTLWRLCTEPLLPFDYGATVAELLGTLRDLAGVAGNRLDLSGVIAEAEALRADTERLRAASAAGGDEARIAALNDCIVALGRALTPVNYTATGEYDHDLALPAQPIPALQPLRQLAGLDPASDEAHYLHTQLLRARNRVWHALHRARAAIAAVA